MSICNARKVLCGVVLVAAATVHASEGEYVFYISNSPSPSSDNGSISHYDPEEIQNDVEISRHNLRQLKQFLASK